MKRSHSRVFFYQDINYPTKSSDFNLKVTRYFLLKSLGIMYFGFKSHPVVRARVNMPLSIARKVIDYYSSSNSDVSDIL